MNYRKWLTALVAVVALALVAGCGSSSSTTSSTSSSGSLGGTDTTAGTDTTGSSSSSDTAVADFKSSCDNLVNGLPSAGQSAAQSGCDQAAQALQQCVDSAPSDADVKTCDDAAKQAEVTLKQAAAATP